MAAKPKWGGFSRQYSRTLDRDPYPNIPFCTPAPLLTRKEKLLAKIIGVGFIGVYFLMEVFK